MNLSVSTLCTIFPSVSDIFRIISAHWGENEAKLTVEVRTHLNRHYLDDLRIVNTLEMPRVWVIYPSAKLPGDLGGSGTQK